VPVVEPRERCEHAYAYDPSRIRQPRMEVPRVGDRIFTLPPTQHSKPNAGPNAGPDEIASEQMADRVEPCCDGEVKRAPIERHHEHEEYRNGPHFPILSLTPSVAPAIPREGAAVRGAITGQGCARQQHRQRCGQQHSHRFLLRLGQRARRRWPHYIRHANQTASENWSTGRVALACRRPPAITPRPPPRHSQARR